MKITRQTTDAIILEELGGRLAKIRLDHNLTQAELARQAGISKRTVERLEAGEVATQLSGFIRVCRVLGLVESLDQFIPEPVPSPVAQLKWGAKKRQRASTPQVTRVEEKKWEWGTKP